MNDELDEAVEAGAKALCDLDVGLVPSESKKPTSAESRANPTPEGVKRPEASPMTDLSPEAGIENMPNPTETELQSPEFEAIWNQIKGWDVNVPEFYSGYCHANGSHVVLILRAAYPAIRKQVLGEVEGRIETKRLPSRAQMNRASARAFNRGLDAALTALKEDGSND